MGKALRWLLQKQALRLLRPLTYVALLLQMYVKLQLVALVWIYMHQLRIQMNL